MAGLPLGDAALDLGQDLGPLAAVAGHRLLEQADGLARLRRQPQMSPGHALGRVENVRVHLPTELGDLLHDLLAGRGGHDRQRRA